MGGPVRYFVNLQKLSLYKCKKILMNSILLLCQDEKLSFAKKVHSIDNFLKNAKKIFLFKVTNKSFWADSLLSNDGWSMDCCLQKKNYFSTF